MLRLDPRLAAIHAQEYPRFSDAEMARRRAALERVMAEAGVDHLLVCGEQRTGTGVAWLTGWPTTVEAYVIVAPREPQRMYVEWYNHWPLARKLAHDTEVRWGEHQGIDKVVADLRARGTKRIGLIGALGYAKCRKVEATFGPLVDLKPAVREAPPRQVTGGDRPTGGSTRRLGPLRDTLSSRSPGLFPVSDDYWAQVRDLMVERLRTGPLCTGIVAAVGEVARVLARHFPHRPDDVNELPDDVSLR